MTTFPGILSHIKNYSFSENAFLPKIVTIPLSQDIGGPCKASVSLGDVVREGEVIAFPAKAGEIAKIHSSVPGKVVEIVNSVCPNGKRRESVKIKFEGAFSYLGKQTKENEWYKLSPSDISEKINEMGIVNTYSAQKPVALSRQISDISGKKKKYIIARLFDEDPYRITDSLVTKLYLEDVRTGARILAKAIGADGILYVFGDYSTGNSEIFKNLELNSDEKILNMNTKRYPAGYKREICTLYNKVYKKNKTFEAGNDDLFVDSSTLYEVYRAVVFDMPVISKHIHIGGNCLQCGAFLDVKIGTSLKDIVSQLGGFEVSPALIVFNGLLCGYSVQSLDVPVTKYVKSISFMSAKKRPDQLMYNCISCGNCRNVCTRGISPDLLYHYKTEGKPVSAACIDSAGNCSECGLCNSVCPSRLPLSQVIASIKKDSNANSDGFAGDL